jgi:hypothetical protein
MDVHTKNLTEPLQQRKPIEKLIRLITYVQKKPFIISWSSLRRIDGLISLLKDYYNKSPLPQSRTEFIIRSALYEIFTETEQYFQLLIQIRKRRKKNTE